MSTRKHWEPSSTQRNFAPIVPAQPLATLPKELPIQIDKT